MFDRVVQLLKQLTSGHSLAGHTLQARMRNATLAYLGVIAAISLGFVAVLANQSWSVLSLGPIPAAPGPQAVGDATALFTGGGEAGEDEFASSPAQSSFAGAASQAEVEFAGSHSVGSVLAGSNTAEGGQAQIAPVSPGGKGTPPPVSEPVPGSSPPTSQPGPIASNPPSSGGPPPTGGSGKSTAGTPVVPIEEPTDESGGGSGEELMPPEEVEVPPEEVEVPPEEVETPPEEVEVPPEEVETSPAEE
jgi:hypothetical protein